MISSILFTLFIYILSKNIKFFKYLKLEIDRINYPNSFLILKITVDIVLFIFFIAIILLFLDALFLNFTNFFYK